MGKPAHLYGHQSRLVCALPIYNRCHAFQLHSLLFEFHSAQQDRHRHSHGPVCAHKTALSVILRSSPCTHYVMQNGSQNAVSLSVVHAIIDATNEIPNHGGHAPRLIRVLLARKKCNEFHCAHTLLRRPMRPAP